MQQTRRRIVSLIALTLMAIFGSATALAAPASAEAFHTSYMTKTFTPWLSTTSQGPQYWPIKAGVSVSMRCWNTGAYVDGTAKWFWVQSNAYPYTRGYVPANDVGHQWLSSPHC